MFFGQVLRGLVPCSISEQGKNQAAFPRSEVSTSRVSDREGSRAVPAYPINDSRTDRSGGKTQLFSSSVTATGAEFFSNLIAGEFTGLILNWLDAAEKRADFLVIDWEIH